MLCQDDVVTYFLLSSFVIPAQAGIQKRAAYQWIPDQVGDDEKGGGEEATQQGEFD